ncbi:MAG: PAS domain S-box protein, partial [Lentisphaerae bacterium]|nr:PAS domain S-box protein [Lentisphaerota bacterium]
SEELMLMDPFMDLAHPDYREIFNERHLACERGEAVSSCLEFRIITKKKEERWVYLTVGEVTFNGQPAVLGTAFDITERKRVEEALRSSEARFRSYFELPLIGIAITSPTKGWLEANDRLCKMLGYSRQELVVLTWAELTHPEDLAADVKQFDLMMSGEIDNYSMEKRFIGKGGATVCTGMSIGCVRKHDGTVDYVLALLQDITEPKLLEERLRQSEKMEAIGQLAGDDSNLRDCAENIIRASKRSADLTRDLLAFSRKGKYLTVPVQVHKIIGEVVSILEHSIDKRVAIKLILKANLATIMGDPSQLQNALLNLAINARDAMPNGGELVFNTANLKIKDSPLNPELAKNISGRCLKISVSDNGIGMDKEVVKHIFEPFFTTKEKGKGVGMGLPSVYGTVQSHHGVINVHSEPGRGTVFSIYFPLSEDIPEQANAVSDAVKTSRKATIMLVEDEEMISNMVSRILNSFGHKVISCRDGIEAVTQYRNTWKSIDLVILDLIMPRMSGKDTFLAMKEINPDVKVLLASGFSIDGEAQSVMKMGAIGFIQKPFNMNELSKGIADGLDGKKSN